MHHRTRAIRACSAVALAGLALLATGCREGEPADPAASQPTSQSGQPTPSKPMATGETATDEPDTEGKRSLVDAAEAGGLQKLTGEGALSDVPVDPGEMRDGMQLVAGNYQAPGAQGDPVLFEGVDNVPEDTNKRREHLFRGMLDHLQWDPELGQPQAEPVDAGPLGGSVECLLVPLSESGNVICGWADSKTAAVALFPDSTLADAGELFVRMRSDLER